MSLPRLLLIADRFARDHDVGERALAAVKAGVSWVQLRDHEADPSRFAREARSLCAGLRNADPRVIISINGRADVARDLDAWLHVGYRVPDLPNARKSMGDGLLTVAVHTLDEARAALDAHADGLIFGPVYPTTSKPGQPGTGLEMLVRITAASKVPTIAIGGITPERAEACRRAGAHGVAVVSGLLAAHADALPGIVSRFQNALAHHPA